jgi:hypothetical protein
MRKHSKVELSVDFTELMTQSFIFNSQVGVLNVKRCKRDVIDEIKMYLDNNIENLDYKTEEGKEMSVKRGLVKFCDNNYYN